MHKRKTELYSSKYEKLATIIQQDKLVNLIEIDELLKISQLLLEDLANIHNSGFLHNNIKIDNVQIQLPSINNPLLLAKVINLNPSTRINNEKNSSTAQDILAMGEVLMHIWGFDATSTHIVIDILCNKHQTLEAKLCFDTRFSNYLDTQICEEKFPFLSDKHLTQIKSCFKQALYIQPENRANADDLAKIFANIQNERLIEISLKETIHKLTNTKNFKKHTITTLQQKASVILKEIQILMHKDSADLALLKKISKKTSLLLQNPTKENLASYTKLAHKIQGQLSLWKNLVGAMLMFASIVAASFTGGLSLLGVGVAAGFFYHGREKGLVTIMQDLNKAVFENKVQAVQS